MTATSLLAGDALDVVVATDGAAVAVAPRCTACLPPSPFESPRPLRALPVTALAASPATAVLARLALPVAATLDPERLAAPIDALRIAPGALDALAAALRIACVDRAEGAALLASNARTRPHEVTRLPVPALPVSTARAACHRTEDRQHAQSDDGIATGAARRAQTPSQHRGGGPVPAAQPPHPGAISGDR